MSYTKYVWHKVQVNVNIGSDKKIIKNQFEGIRINYVRNGALLDKDNII